MVKTVQVCTAGECGGECYRCRLKAVLKERDWFAKMAVDLLKRLGISGNFGPWSDGWTEDHQRLWEMADESEVRSANDNK